MAVEISGPRYILLDIDSRSADTEVEAVFFFEGTGIGIIQPYLDNAPFGGMLATRSNAAARVNAQVSNVPLSFQQDLSSESGIGLIRGLDVGRYAVLLFVAGEASSWRYVVRGSDFTATVTETGSTYAFRPEDASGLAWAHGHTLGAGAYGAVGDRYEFDVEGQLFGTFLGNGLPDTFVGTAQLTNATDATICPCILRDIFGPQAFGPGHYALEWSGLGVGLDAREAYWADISTQG